MVDPILRANGLCSFYGSSQVLFDVSIEVPQRGCVAVLGRNGAGKSTLLNTLIGELPLRAGRIQFGDRSITHRSSEWRVRQGLGLVPQEKAVFSALTVRENLQVGAMAGGDGDGGIDQVLHLFPRLAERLAQPAGTLSGGERKMLAIGRALLGRPRLLMLDEPTEGVWHGVVEEIAERLEALARDIAVLIVEQHLQLALRVSRYCYVMDRGRMVLEGASADVRNDVQLERLLAP